MCIRDRDVVDAGADQDVEGPRLVSPANSVLPVSKRPCRHADLDRHGLTRIRAHHRVTRQPANRPVDTALGPREIDLDLSLIHI